MVGAVDGWDIAAKTYQDNFPTAKVVTTRLKRGTGSEIFGNLRKVDILIASPECTNHSIARGNKPIDEEGRRSGWYIMDFVRDLNPRWVVLENVTPMRRWFGFDDLIADLKRSYRIRVKFDNFAPRPDLRMVLVDRPEIADFVLADDFGATGNACRSSVRVKVVKIEREAAAPDVTVSFAPGDTLPDYRVYVHSARYSHQDAAALLAALWKPGVASSSPDATSPHPPAFVNKTSTLPSVHALA